MKKQETNDYPLFRKMEELLKKIIDSILIDQWLKECTQISFIVFRIFGAEPYIYLYKKKRGRFSYIRKKANQLKDKERNICDFLNEKYGENNYLLHKLTVDELEEKEVVCVLRTPIIENNKGLGRGLVKYTLDELVGVLSEEHICVDVLEEISLNNRLLRIVLMNAAKRLCNRIEDLYLPIDIGGINELSGEYYEKAECKSNLLFLPWVDDSKINDKIFQFDFSLQNIEFTSDKARCIRKLLQIAQKDTYLVFQCDKKRNVYKVRGICKGAEISNLLVGGNKKNPWLIAKIRNHMRWDLYLGDEYIFSFRNGNYKITVPIDETYLKKKCQEVFKEKQEFANVVNCIQQSCQQVHGTMLLILKKEDALQQVIYFSENMYGMMDSRVEKMEEVVEKDIDINLFNSIDGSLILDTTGKIYGIGVILDSKVSVKGNIGRGARYNSAIRYREYLRRKNIPGLIVIVSEDGSVEVMDSIK